MSNFKTHNKEDLAQQLEETLGTLYNPWEKSVPFLLANDLHAHQIELEMQNRELRELQQKLEESRDRYADLYDYAPVGYLTFNAKGCITEINLTGARMLGLERDRIFGQPMSLWLAPEYQQAFLDHLNLVLKSTIKNAVELKIKNHSDITAYDVQLESVAAVDGDNNKFCRTVMHDISFRKKYEAELIRTIEEADIASQVKSKFLSRMSHELRTPLHTILGFAQIMELSGPETRLSEHRDSLNKIISSGRHLLRMIDRLLNLTSMEANKIDLKIENVSVNESIRDCVKVLFTFARRNGIKIDFNKNASENLFVRADSFRLKQILMNMITNAVKYNRAGGTVTIRSQARPFGRIGITVTDTHSSIPMEDIQILLHSCKGFSGRENEIKSEGMGLSSAKMLTELMEGKIGIESVSGQGNTFWIELPEASGSMKPQAKIIENKKLQPKTKRMEKSPGTSDEKVRQFTILYIENSPDHVQLLEAVVKTMPDIRLLTAYTPTYGLELAQKNLPDIILVSLDICVPGMKCFELLDQLHDGESTREIPVVAVSSNGLPEDIEATMHAGFSDHLTKPINLTEFYKTVKDLRYPQAI